MRGLILFPCSLTLDGVLYIFSHLGPPSIPCSITLKLPLFTNSQDLHCLPQWASTFFILSNGVWVLQYNLLCPFTLEPLTLSPWGSLSLLPFCFEEHSVFPLETPHYFLTSHTRHPAFYNTMVLPCPFLRTLQCPLCSPHKGSNNSSHIPSKGHNFSNDDSPFTFFFKKNLLPASCSFLPLLATHFAILFLRGFLLFSLISR